MKLKKNIKLLLVDIIEVSLVILLWDSYKILTYDWRGIFTISTVIGSCVVRKYINKKF